MMEQGNDIQKNRGHIDHIKAANSGAGLAGKIHRPMKIVILGAGSSFTPRLINDVLKIPGIQGGEIALIDIDANRLSTMYKLIGKLVAANCQGDIWQVIASSNRREALRGAHYIINCIEVSGIDCVRFDYDIPLEYGIDQCIGDTSGPGGLFKGLRTIPVFLEILSDCEEMSPEAYVLNYTNPMSMMCIAAARSSSMQVFGMCHSVQGTSRLLAKRAGVPFIEMTWECAGINHLAWFTKLEHRGKDLYPLLKEKAKNDLSGNPVDPEDGADLVRKDIMLHFGAFVTESSGHLSEYLSYYRVRKDIKKKYCGNGYDGESGFYSRNWPEWRKEADRDREKMLRGEKPIKWERSWEYASWIIEAREKDTPFRFHANVMNNHKKAGLLIENLPYNGCVEVASMVGRSGIHPTVYGKLPPQMAALCGSLMGAYELAVDAVIEKSKEAAILSLMLDPLTSAVCSPSEIREMTLKLFRAEKDYLPNYQ